LPYSASKDVHSVICIRSNKLLDINFGTAPVTNVSFLLDRTANARWPRRSTVYWLGSNRIRKKEGRQTHQTVALRLPLCRRSA